MQNNSDKATRKKYENRQTVTEKILAIRDCQLPFLGGALMSLWGG